MVVSPLQIYFLFCIAFNSQGNLRQVVNGWRNQCILVGQDSGLYTTRHRQVTTNFPRYSAQAEKTSDLRC